MRRSGTSLAVAAFLLAIPSLAQSRTRSDRSQHVANPRVAAVLQALDGLEAKVDQARRDVHTVRRQAEARAAGQAVSGGKETTPFAPPPSLVHRIDRTRRQVDATIRPLLGQRWAEAEPALRRAERIRSRLEQLQQRLAAPLAAPAERARDRRAASGSSAITGRVVDARNGAPVEATVTVYDLGGYYVDSVQAQGGTYSIGGLAAGTYLITARTYSGPSYIGELYDDIPCEGYCDVTVGTPVTAVDGQVTSGINFALTPASTIGGTVIDDATEQPLVGIEIDLYDGQGNYVDSTETAADGTYLFRRVVPAIYFAMSWDRYYIDQLYPGVACQPSCSLESGTPITVAAGAAVSGIDFHLQLGGSVSGAVTDQATGNPITGYGAVYLYAADGEFIDSVWLGASGQYQVFDLPTGSYYALTSTSRYFDEIYDNVPCEPTCTLGGGTPIAVTVGQEHGGVDFALVRAGSISGTLSDSANGAPIASVYVDVIDSGGVYQAYGESGPAGDYQAGGLGNGSYFVVTRNYTYVDELFDDILCEPSCNPTTGTPIAVTGGADTGGIDFSLDLGGSIVGHVVSAGGLPIEDVEVDVYASDGTVATYGLTDSAGGYAAPGLVSGSYFALVQDDGYYPDILPELYRELPCPAGCDPTAGTPIAVTTGQPTTGIAFTPNRLGRISGRVTIAGSGLPAMYSYVVAYAAPSGSGYAYGYVSDYRGNYVIPGLPAGSYFVITDSSEEQNLVDQLYANKTCEPSCDVTQGTPVTVALDTTTAGIDFALRKPTFADVPVDHWAWKWVEAAYAAGVTGGCATAPLRFCPDAGVTRDQSAVVLLRAKDGPTYVPPPATGMFQDVPVSNPFAPWVEELVRRGVTTGCSTSPSLFCPANAVTRAQSAPFLLRTHDGAAYVPPPATGVFGDVPASDPFARWVEELVRRGVTAGCSTNPSLFCPGSSVTRAQFAVFLGRTFGLTLP